MKNLVHKKLLLSALILWSILIYPIATLAKDEAKPNKRLSKTTNVSNTGGRSGKPGVRVQPAPDETKGIMNPDRIEQGKAIPVIITFSNCKTEWNGLTPTLDATSVALLTQSGIQITNLRPIIAPNANAECTVFAFISILRTTPAITYSFKIKIAEEPAQEVVFRVTGLQGIPPGPIPPGLEPPAVDVMWSVVPKKITSDNFGPRVARNFYCIEIVIGNNSGYNLQVSAVGFKSGPVGEYATAIAATHESLARKQADIAQHSSDELKAAIDECKNLKSDFAQCVATITRPILDRLRNQSQADLQTTKVLTETGTEASRMIYGNTIPVTGYPLARGSATRGEFWSIRNWTTRLLAILGPIAIGFTPFLDVKNQKNYSNAVNLFTNPISEGFSNFWPDEFIPQLQRLDDQILREGRMISNNRQERTTVFIPKKLLRIDKKYIDDPRVITIALGQLVLIGNLISFLNRVSVTSNPNDGEIGAAPVVDPTFQSEFAQESSGTLAVTGSELEGARITSPDGNITAAATTSTRTSASAVLTVLKGTPLGSHTLLLTTSRGSVRLEITVVPPLPSGVSEPNIPAGNGTDQSPAASRPVAQEFPFTIAGANLLGTRLERVDPNETLTTSGITSTNTELSGTITVPRNTPAGSHTFRIVNNSSLNSLTSGPVVQFKVEDPTAVPDVTPDPAIPENDRRVRIGQAPRTVNFNLTGSRLRFARTVTPVTLGAVPVVNCEDLPNVPAPVSHVEVPCRFTIGANLQDLSADTTYEYRISDGNNTRSDTFRIMVLAPRQISVDTINGDKRPDTLIPVTATNVEGVTVRTADEDPNWNVRVVPGSVTAGGFQIIITPKPGRPTDTERTVRVTFTNSDGTRSERREIQLVAAVATAVTPNPE